MKNIGAKNGGNSVGARRREWRWSTNPMREVPVGSSSNRRGVPYGFISTPSSHRHAATFLKHFVPRANNGGQ